MEKTIILFGAHSDDQAFGAGATLAKYHDQGYKIVIVLFSYGEKSHVWMKKSIIRKLRHEESVQAGKLLGYSRVIFFGAEEGKFARDAAKLQLPLKIEQIITRYKPEKIFLHSHDDPHTDHKTLNKIVLGAIDKMRYRGEVYVFDVWNIFSHKRRVLPRVFVNVDEHFNLKIKALRLFKSQKVALFTLFWSVYVRAVLNGFVSGSRFAEKFLRVR